MCEVTLAYDMIVRFGHCLTEHQLSKDPLTSYCVCMCVGIRQITLGLMSGVGMSIHPPWAWGNLLCLPGSIILPAHPGCYPRRRINVQVCLVQGVGSWGLLILGQPHPRMGRWTWDRDRWNS